MTQTQTSRLSVLEHGLARLPVSLRPALPDRGRRFLLGALGVTALAYFAYLFVLEFNLAEWNPYGSPFNLLASGLLTVVLVTLLHLLTRRFWSSLTLGLGLILFLAAWSDLKFRMNGFSLTAIDLLIIDPASVSFAWNQPDFRWYFIGTIGFFALAITMLVVERPGTMRFWRRLGQSLAALLMLFGVLFASFPGGAKEAMQIGFAYHVTIFTKSLLAIVDYFRQDGVLEKLPPPVDAPPPGATACVAPQGKKLPHIVMIIDEASIDTTRITGFSADPQLEDHFTSFDGSRKSLRAETFGGGTWLTELSALTGLSTRAFGPFAPVATRLVADRVRLSLPEWLGQCGYTTRSIYPAGGRFNAARRMHDGLKVQSFEDWFDLKLLDPSLPDALQLRDKVYYGYALDRIAKEPQKPSFTFLWLTGNHTPWTEPLSPEEKVEGLPAYTDPQVTEYVRRQRLSDVDLRAFKALLSSRFPQESFLIVRFGDHLPFIGGKMIDPDVPQDKVWQKIDKLDPQYFTTYLAVDAINFVPSMPMPKPDIIAAGFLGLLTLQMAGLPLNPVAHYQSTIFDRCDGLLVECENGDASRRFNGWLTQHRFVDGL
jgi:hypothetical protein